MNELLIAGLVMVGAVGATQVEYEDSASYAAHNPGETAACYSYGGGNTRNGYGSGITIYHCPGQTAAKPVVQAKRREK